MGLTRDRYTSLANAIAKDVGLSCADLRGDQTDDQGGFVPDADLMWRFRGEVIHAVRASDQVEIINLVRPEMFNRFQWAYRVVTVTLNERDRKVLDNMTLLMVAVMIILIEEPAA